MDGVGTTTTEDPELGTTEGKGTAEVAGGAWIWPSEIWEMGWTWGAAATAPARRATEAREKRILIMYVCGWVVLEML